MKTFLKKLTSVLVTMALLFSMAATNIPISVTAAETDPVPADTVKLTFQITNAVVKDGSGVIIPVGEYTTAPGTVLTIKVESKEGFGPAVVTVNGNALALDQNGTASITAEEGMIVAVSAADVTAPVISAVTRQETGWAKEATYQITATDNDKIASCTICADGGTEEALAAQADGTYLATVKQNGTYTITVKDAAGLSATQTITEVQVDTVAPEVVSLDRVTEGVAVKADYILDAADADSGIQKVEVTAGEITETVTANAEGKYAFQIAANAFTVKVVDNAGNETVQTITDNDVDVTPPVITYNRTGPEWSNSTVTYEITVTDERNQAVTVKTSDGSSEQELTPDENGVLSFTVSQNGTTKVIAIDVLGNSSYVDITEDHIDTENPAKPTLTSTANGQWVNTEVTITAEASDTQSGVAAYWYTAEDIAFDPAVWQKMTFAEGKGTLVLTDEQNATYSVVAEDASGRYSEIATISVTIDKTAPADIVVSYTETAEAGFHKILNGTYIYKDQMGFSATAQDPDSGVAKYEYCVEGESERTEWVALTAGPEGIAQILNDLEDGIYTVVVRVTDTAGNCSDETTVLNDTEAVKFAIENTPASEADRAEAPTISMTAGDAQYAGEWTNADVVITAEGPDAASGIEYYEYAVDFADPELTDTGWSQIPVVDGKPQLKIDVDTNAVFTFRAMTNAGNLTQECSHAVKVQKTIPNAATITADAPTGTNGWYTQYPQYEITLPEQAQYFAPVSYDISYSVSEVVKTPISYNGTNSPIVNEDGTWKITITATDAAGNKSVVETSTVTLPVDTKVPDQISAMLNGNNMLVAGEAEQKWDNVNTATHIVDVDFTEFLFTDAKITAAADGGTSGLAALYYMTLADGCDVASGTWQLLGDGATITTDRKCHVFFKAVDNAGNTSYFTGTSFIVDKTAPTGANSSDLTLVPQAANRSEQGYYNGDVTISVQAVDPMVTDDKVFSGLSYIAYEVYADGELTQSGQIFPGSGTTELVDERVQAWSGGFTILASKNNSNHITVTVQAVDQAGNARTTTIEDGVIRIDTDTPVMQSAYDTNDNVTTFDGKAAFTGSRTLTVQVTERNFDANNSFVTVTNTDTGAVSRYNWISTGDFHKAVIEIAEDGHYSVSATVTDLAGNSTSGMGFVSDTVGANSFIIDNTNPSIYVSYNNDNAQNGMYFNAKRVATVVVLERNFDPANVHLNFTVTTENGAIRTVVPGNWISTGNTHTAYVTCATDGVYAVSVTGSDALGNKAKMTDYSGTAPNAFVIDTKFAAPVISQVEEGNAYPDSISPKATVTDINLESVEATLVRTRRDEIAVDVTSEMLKGKFNWADIANGKEAILDVFPEIQDYDGIYTLTVTGKDKAGNTAKTSVTFSVNRFGSVYVYDELLIGILNGYMQEVPGDLIITEYNPSGIVPGTAKVYITLDGMPLSDPEYTVEPPAAENMKPGTSGWFEHRYVISKDNFSQDGVYELVISTEDNAGNIPENTSEEQAIRFAVDNQAPELTSIIGLEEKIYNADSINATISIQDNVALGSVVVYVNDEVVAQWDNIEAYELQEQFTVPAGLAKHIRIVVTDMAGNELDTDSDAFAPGYEFNKTVTVSTNILLRYFANKPLFYGTIGAAGLAAIIAVLLILKKKKK